MELWRRSAVLKFGVKGKSEITVDTDKLFRNGSPIPQIAFDITNSIIDKNKATISVYNLVEESRDLIDEADKEEDITVELYLGYGGENFRVFKGEATQAENSWDGTDYITTFKAYDGLKASKKKYNKSHAPKTNYADVVKDALKGLGDTVSGVVIDVKKEISQNGLTLSGATDVIMGKLMAAMPKQNLEFTIQDGIAYVKPAGSMTNPNDIPIISQDTGMIGAPKKTKKGIEFDSLIQRGLTPTRGIELVSKKTKYNGIFIIQKSKYSGETRGSEWKATCTAIRKEAAKPV